MPRLSVRALIGATAIWLAVTGCRNRVGSVAQQARPHLISLTPASGSHAGGAVVLVEISGEGLTATDNTVYFGSIKMEGLSAAAEGRTIKFTVPETVPSRGEAPPMSVPAGSYPVYVANANGVSDTLFFTLKGQ